MNASLIFNTFTNSYIAISNVVCDAFQKLTLEDFRNLYRHSYNKFIELGIIIPSKKDELAIIRYNNKLATFASRDLRLVVYPTQDCNLKCWYCYESHVPNTRMSKNVSERILKLVQKSIIKNTYDNYFVTLFGGEPLTDFETIAGPLLIKMKSMIETAGKSFNCFFVTNGSLIDEDKIKLLKLIKPHFQITLDGDKDHHDNIRKWKLGNKPTYNHIMWVLHRLVEEINGDNFFITLRINYDNNTLPGVFKILEDIKDIDRHKIFIHFERVWQTEGETTDKERTLLLDLFKKFIEEGFCVNQGNFKGYAYSCPTEIRDSIIINYDGTIHKCNGRTLSDKTKYGILKEDGTLLLDEDLLAQRLSVATFEHKECLQCKMLPLCMGPCSQKLLEHGGEWTKDICSFGSIDTSLNDYILTDFWVKSLVEKYKNNG